MIANNRATNRMQTLCSIEQDVTTLACLKSRKSETSRIAVQGAPSSCSRRISFKATRTSVNRDRPLYTVAFKLSIVGVKFILKLCRLAMQCTRRRDDLHEKITTNSGKDLKSITVCITSFQRRFFSFRLIRTLALDEPDSVDVGVGEHSLFSPPDDDNVLGEDAE
uniref:Uncharacterized protein n=1 Tax=Romanomermis culicivorax TaxID=13658 RepID=A0A915L7G4_ROMCU